MTKAERVRYDISSLTTIANRPVSPKTQEKAGPLVRVLAGETNEGLFWIATQDFDAQIEISCSLSKKRPNNWQVKQFFERVKMVPFVEESRAVGRVRHFVVQKGRMQ